MERLIQTFNSNTNNDDDDDLEFSTTNMKVDIGVSNLYFCHIDNKFSIREYTKTKPDSHELVAGKRGCNLDIAVVYELITKLHVADLDMENFRKNYEVDVKHSLGGGWFIAINNPFPLVHIRKFETIKYYDMKT